MIFASVTAAQPLIDAGRLRPIAVSTAKRSALIPNMPTLHESGVPDYDRTGWYGMMGPAGLSKDVLSKLNSSIVKSGEYAGDEGGVLQAGPGSRNEFS